MPWKETDVTEQRLRFIVAAQRPGATLSALCREFGVSRPTGRKWRDRARAAPALMAALSNRSCRPRRSPRQTPPHAIDAVVALRRQYGWAGAKLQPLLQAQGVTLSVATIDRIIRRTGLTDLEEQHRPALRRFTAPHPNALWQMDFKGAYPCAPGAWCHPLSVLDDHSRFAVGLTALSSQHGAGVRVALVEAFHQYGVPDRLLVDHGTPWWHRGSAQGLTQLTVFLIQQGITLRFSGVRHPQTQGKVERFHRTLGRRLRQWGVPTQLSAFAEAFTRFRHEYNSIRPHASLGQQPPSVHYHPSPRPYRPVPPAWRYPAAMATDTVERLGHIRVGRQRLFVSEALAGQTIGYLELPDRWLVAFRHLWVAEIQRATGQTVPLHEPMDVLNLETRS
jgi:transposase InsO family protein